MNLQKVEFVKSAASASGFISDGMPQIVFSGRSNVGKSSVINRLLNRRNMARISSSPGKTIHINYFLIDKTAWFVDLPGYGYAKVSKAERARWSKLMEAYFSASGHIALGVLIVDARHNPTADDIVMADWFKTAARPLVVAANKADKVKGKDKEACMARIRETLTLSGDTAVIPFSAVKGTNRDILLTEIENAVNGWYNG